MIEFIIGLFVGGVSMLVIMSCLMMEGDDEE